MSLMRFLYDPHYSLDDFSRFVDDAYTVRFTPGLTGNQDSNSTIAKPFSPRLDIHEDAEGNKVTASFELPGLKKEDVNIDVHNDRLTVSGESNVSTESHDKGYTIRERRFGKFSRSLALPKGTKPEDISAKMENGVLNVSFPKTNPDQTPSRIAIN